MYRAQQTYPGPKIVPFERFVHVEPGERREDRECDDFLHDLELGKAHLRMPEAVGGNLEQVFEAGDAPAEQRGDVPWPVAQVFEMPVPGKGHKNIGNRQEKTAITLALHQFAGKVRRFLFDQESRDGSVS